MIQVYYQKEEGKDSPELDQVVLTDADGNCLFHLEQMSKRGWWIGVYDGKRRVYINLTTKRAEIRGVCDDAGEEPSIIKGLK